jgi:hypothetical protein
MAGKYVRVGLRRDKNFSDLESTYSSLGNLLNNLAPPGKSFIPDDIQVLNNVSEDSNVTNDSFLELKGNTRTATQIRFRTPIQFSSAFETVPFTDGFSFLKSGEEVLFETVGSSNAVYDAITETYTYFYNAVILTNSSTVPFSVDEDLIIQSTGITISDIDPTQETLDNFLIEPNITIKDTIENAKVITGDPPYLAGGDGLKAKFYPSDSIATAAQRSSSISGYELFNYAEAYLGGGAGFHYGPFDFWESGYFGFGPSIYDSPEFINGLGGVQWEGFFAPIPYIVDNNWQIVCSGLIIIEQDIDGNNNWQKVLNIHDKERELVSQTSGAVTTITLSDDDLMKVGVGDQVTFITSQGNIFNTFTKVDNVDYQGKTITLDQAVNVANGDIIKVSFPVGFQDITTQVKLSVPGLNVKRKVRISVYWPNDAGYDSFRKRCSFAYIQESATRLPASFLYTTDSVATANTNVNSFEYFLDNYVNLSNDRTTAALQVNDKAIISYDPPLTFANKVSTIQVVYIGNGVFSYAGLGGAPVYQGDRVILSLGNSYLQLLAIGDSPNESAFYVDEEDVINYNSGAAAGEEISGDANTSGGPYSGFRIDNIGLKDIFLRYNSAGNFVSMLSVSNEDELAKDQLVYAMKGSGTTLADEGPVRLSTISKSAGEYTLTVDDHFGGSYADFLGDTNPDNTILLVYKDKALEDLSKVNYCNGVIGHLITADALSGANEIFLDDVSDVQQSYYIQFSGYIPDGTQITGVDSGTNKITLSNNLTKTLKQNYTITIIPGNPGAESYEICVLPLDTAPPFTGTDTGLKTASGVENIKTNELLFDNLYIKNLIDEDIGNQEYTKTMNITHDNGVGVRKVYKLLVF